GLLPDDDPREVADRLHRHPDDGGDVAIVGHEPHLSALAALLVRGKARADLFVLKKCALLTLERTASVHKKTGRARWRVRWQVSPELLPSSSPFFVSPPKPGST